MEPKSSTFKQVIKILLTVAFVIVTPWILLFALLLFAFGAPQWGILLCFIPFVIPAIWIKRRKPYLITFVCLFLVHRYTGKRKRFTVNSVHRFTQGVDNFFHSSFLICFMSKSAVEPGKIF